MEFKINSKLLLASLQVVANAIDSNPILPILEYFLFTIKGNKLTVRGTDLNTTIVADFDIVCKDDFDFCMPALRVLDTLKEIADQPITIAVGQAKDGGVKIGLKSLEGVYKMAGEVGSDYPALQTLAANQQEYQLDKKSIFSAFKNAVSCTTNDELRPALCGVLFRINDENIEIVGTDAHKLYYCKIAGTYKKHEIDTVIPGQAIRTLISIPIESEAINVVVCRSHAIFSFDNIRFYARLTDVKYLRFNEVVPKDPQNFATMQVADLKGALKRLGFYSEATKNGVVLNIANDEVSLHSEDELLNKSADETLICEYKGTAIRIGCNYKYMNVILNGMYGDEVTLEMTTPTQAMILKGKELEGQESFYLLMPIMLSTLVS